MRWTATPHFGAVVWKQRGILPEKIQFYTHQVEALSNPDPAWQVPPNALERAKSNLHALQLREEGETRTLYALASCNLDMIILHGIQMQGADLDFVVITRKMAVYISCKYWDCAHITITGDGAFLPAYVTDTHPTVTLQGHSDNRIDTLRQTNNATLSQLQHTWIRFFSLDPEMYRTMVVFTNPNNTLHDHRIEPVQPVVKTEDAAEAVMQMEWDTSPLVVPRSKSACESLARKIILQHHPSTRYQTCPLCGSRLSTCENEHGISYLICSKFPDCTYMQSL